jgi:hypothetical protein
MNGIGGKNEEGIDHRLHMLDGAHVGGLRKSGIRQDGSNDELRCGDVIFICIRDARYELA